MRELLRYKMVKQRLTETLRDGKWKHGQLIPSEPLLAKRFGVSIGTVRKAIDQLVAEGILDRQQGRGTFVVSHTRNYLLDVFFQIFDREGNKEPAATEVLGFQRTRADAAAATALGIKRGEPIFRSLSLLKLKGKPVIVDDMRLPVTLFGDLTAQILATRESTLYALLQNRYGVTVVKTIESIEAVVPTAKIRDLLGLREPAAVLRLERTAYTYKDHPVETRTRYIKTANHRYVSVLGKR